LALEGALQVGALVLWSRRGSVAAGEGALLCVGDSFTYGLGATGQAGSYPRQLEALLRENGGAATVVNGGWPGQSSREVLLRLPEQLARHRPARVCILVGINDPVVRPARVRSEELSSVFGEAFRWRLRLPQVLSMMADWLRREEGPPGFVGTWHADDFEVTFEPDGRVRLGKDELRWLADESGTTLLLPNGVAEPMRWQVVGDRLTVSTPSFAHTLDAGPAPAPGPWLRAEAAIARGAWAEAEPLLQQAVADPAHGAAAKERLVQAAVARGDGAARDRLVDELRGDFAAGVDPPTGEALAGALAATGAAAEAMTVCERVLRAAPDRVRTWDLLLRQAAAQGAEQRVAACMAAVLAAARGDEAWRPALLQMRANLRRHDEPVAAVGDLLAAFLQNGDRAFLVRQLELGMADYTPEVRARAVAALPEQARERVRAALAEDGGEAGVQATLRAHLERMIGLCRAAGAEVWLLSYPEPDAARDGLVAGVAMAAGVRFVALHPRFTELLRTTPRPALFIADGHCTDRGYGVMAEAVVEALR